MQVQICVVCILHIWVMSCGWKVSAHFRHKAENEPAERRLTGFDVSPQSSCPVMRRRKRPTMPAQEASTDWTAFPLDPPTPLTPLRRPPEAGWKRQWKASQRRRRWTWTSLKKWWARRSRYLGERGWKIRWDVVGCFWGSSNSSCSFTADNWCFCFFSSTVWESTFRAVLTEDEETQIWVQPVRQHHPGVSERKSGISTQDGDEARRRESLQFL